MRIRRITVKLRTRKVQWMRGRRGKEEEEKEEEGRERGTGWGDGSRNHTNKKSR